MRLVVIGGSDAGTSAGLRARELDPTVEVTLVVADAYPDFSICGLPYHLSGDVPDWRDLAHRTRAALEAAGLELSLDHAARVIDPVLNAHQPPGVEADSAGTDPTDALNPTVVTALAERGISLEGVTPKPLTTELLAATDLVITMSRHPIWHSRSFGLSI